MYMRFIEENAAELILKALLKTAGLFLFFSRQGYR
jgi:hypothetical protein